MSKKHVTIADWDLEDYFPNDDVFQEFLEMFGDSTEDEKDDVIERANEFAQDHNIPLVFCDVNMDDEDTPDQFLWDVIVKETLWAAIQKDREEFPLDE